MNAEIIIEEDSKKLPLIPYAEVMEYDPDTMFKVYDKEYNFQNIIAVILRDCSKLNASKTRDKVLVYFDTSNKLVYIPNIKSISKTDRYLLVDFTTEIKFTKK